MPCPLIPIPNAQRPNDHILTGGQPTEAEFLAAIQAGYTWFINLRGPDEPGVAEAPAFFARHNVSYRHVPIDSPQDLTLESAQALAAALEEAQEGPVMIYCGSGNRVGALCALKQAWCDHCSPQEALNFGLNAGLKALEPMIRHMLSQPPPQQG